MIYSYLHTEFHMPNFNASLAVSIVLTIKQTIHVAAMFFLHLTDI
jgi:hypothetical protein